MKDNHWRHIGTDVGGFTMIDNRPGSGYSILRDWTFKGADGTPQEVIILAYTLLPVRSGPLSKRYVVRHGTPFVERIGTRRGILGEFDDFSEACKTAEAFVGGTQSGIDPT
jgi:hypothetical protein